MKKSTYLSSLLLFAIVIAAGCSKKSNNDGFKPPFVPDPSTVVYHNTPITETVSISPSYHKTGDKDSVYFTLIAQLSKTHCGNSQIGASFSQVSNNYIFSIGDISDPNSAGCALPYVQLPPVGASYYPLDESPIKFGSSYPLTVKIGSTNYVGSIVFNKTYMDITWNYTSGVIFTSKHVTL